MSTAPDGGCDPAVAGLSFRPFAHGDLRMLHEWLQRPHVRRWWGPRESLDDVVEHYLPAIEGDDPTDLYLALLDGRAVGFVQTYLVADYPEFAALTGCGEGVAGVDLFLAGASLTGRGLGSELLRLFVDDVVFARPATVACIADPQVENVASVRVFEKAGFGVVRHLREPETGHLHALVRRERPDSRDGAVGERNR